MDLYEFNLPALKQKAQQVGEKGILLTIKQEFFYDVLLYHFDAFLAEIWFHSDQNETGQVRAFQSNPDLEPYLDLIDLSDIIDDGKIG